MRTEVSVPEEVSSREGREHLDFLFEEDISEIDSDTDLIIGFEEERQARKIILIPSESICPKAVRQALGSVFTSVYAEGYPPLRMTGDEEKLLLDFGHQLAYYRRYADRRFYKGCDYVHFVETLAQRRVAKCFATDGISADEIYVNIQPLSGAAANNSVYDAFLQPGDTVMGMALAHGGHLTHGSEFNRSGKYYNIVSYEVDPTTERLDYGAIKRLTLAHQPKMIITGYTSYPWQPDWEKFREIADAVPGGAILMADIAHPAGMVIAGEYPTPIGYADVITMTTHKTLCGPRGALIITTDRQKARQIDRAIFPGEQGGPHVNKFAAIAVTFKIAQTEKFRRLQRKITENARDLAAALERRGLRLAYGGTNTHLLLIDLNAIETKSGYPLKGEMAARILDLCGIVCNKNTIPGDRTAAEASGIRLGTPWVTQRGMGKHEMEKLAEIIHLVLTNIQTFRYIGRRGEIGRGKIDQNILEKAARQVAELVEEARDNMEQRSSYPHYWLPAVSSVKETVLLPEHKKLGAKMTQRGGWMMPLHYGDAEKELEAARKAAVLFDLGDMGLMEVSGERAKAFMQEVSTNDVMSLVPGESQHSFLLGRKGHLIDDISIFYLGPDEIGRDRLMVMTTRENAEAVKKWFRQLSDGYTIFDEEDIFAKVEGPVVADDLRETDDGDRHRVALALEGPKAREIVERLSPSLANLDEFRFVEGEVRGMGSLVSHTGFGDSERFEFFVHPDHALKLWDLLLQEGKHLGIKPAGILARKELRKRAGLPSYDGHEPKPDASTLLKAEHLALFRLTKPYFIGQRNVNGTEGAAVKKKEFEYEGWRGPLRRTPLYEEHLRLTSRSRMIPFARWSMPVWYTRISEEHRAVRETAGLFDVGHMGILEVAGGQATRFLDMVTTNYVPALRVGRAHYSYLLTPDGEVIDDIIVYRRGKERYMLVVNAANAEKDKAWLEAVNSKGFVIDREDLAKEIDGTAIIRNLKDERSGEDRKVDMSLQGPNSLAILEELAAGDERLRRKLSQLRRFEFIETELRRMEVLLSRSGYTGEEMGFELYVHPDDAPRLWGLLLEKGRPWGIKPAGLGARDSTRMEAGLPLYGQELAGSYNISPLEAGYGAFVKFHKPFFIGRKAMLERDATMNMQIARFKMEAKGGRALRPGDPVVNRRGEYIGTVTSSALAEGFQMGMVYIDRRYAEEGTKIGIFPLGRGREMRRERQKGELELGDRVALHEEAVILSRFPSPEEREREPFHGLAGVGTS